MYLYLGSSPLMCELQAIPYSNVWETLTHLHADIKVFLLAFKSLITFSA